MFGTNVLIQRCQIHKRRNVIEHLPEAERAWVDTKLAKIFADPNPDRGEQAARDLAKALQRKHPGAARLATRRPGADVHRRPPGCHRHPGQDVDLVQPDRYLEFFI